MGEYAVFVWPCYGAVVVLLGFLGFSSWKTKRNDAQKLKELQKEFANLEEQD